MSQITRAYGPQELPEDFAAVLNRMKDDKNDRGESDPRLNAVLVEARRLGWRTASLASALRMEPAAVSKRMERAAAPSWDNNLRDTARVVLRDLTSLTVPDEWEAQQGLRDDLSYLVEIRRGALAGADGAVVTQEDIVFVNQRARAELVELAAEAQVRGDARLAKRLMTLQGRLERAETYEPTPREVIIDSAVADARWLRNMSRSAHGVLTGLRAMPPFLAPAKLRAEAEQQLEALEWLTSGTSADREAVLAASKQARTALSELKREVSPEDPNRRSVISRITRAATRLQVAEEFTAGDGVVVHVGSDAAGVFIPMPPRVQTTLTGNRLPEETIVELRELQRRASRVNGATDPSSDRWRDSERLSELLFTLTEPTEPGAPRYTPYYLAKIMGVTHRAVTTRLDRWRQRHDIPQRRGSRAAVRS